VVKIAMTGWSRKNGQRSLKEAALNRHFVKPIDFAATQRLLANSR
jgi:hypothetical protein